MHRSSLCFSRYLLNSRLSTPYAQRRQTRNGNGNPGHRIYARILLSSHGRSPRNPTIRLFKTGRNLTSKFLPIREHRQAGNETALQAELTQSEPTNRRSDELVSVQIRESVKHSAANRDSDESERDVLDENLTLGDLLKSSKVGEGSSKRDGDNYASRDV